MTQRMKLEEARAAIANAVEKETKHGCHVALVPQLKFAKELSGYRKGAGLSRAQLAKAISCKVQDIANWEDAEAFPSKGQIGSLAAVLGGDDADEVFFYWEYLVADAQEFLAGR